MNFRSVHLLLLFALGFFITVEAEGQDVKRLMSKGKKAFERGGLTLAKEFFHKARKHDSTRADVNGWLGRTYIEMGNGKDGLRYIRKAYKEDPGLFESRIIFLMGTAFQYRVQLDSAMHYYNEFKDVASEKYISAAKKRLEQCEYAQKLMDKPADVKVSNLGSKINSEYGDFTPAVNAFNDMLIFTSTRKSVKNNNISGQGRYYEDIFITRKKGGEWQRAHPVSDKINTEYHDASVSLSPDGKVLYFYRNEDLFKSSLDEDGNWSKPKKLPAPVNREDSYENHVFLSPYGEKLYFTSDRKGGYGGSDIYVAEKTEDGAWGKVQNLGPTINTSRDEDGPYLDITGETLYFSSDGHKTMGGSDLFRSTYKEEEGGWTEPENLGYPVNSTKDDDFFTMSGGGKYAYFSSIKENTEGQEDIYRLDLPADWVSKNVKKEMRRYKKAKGLVSGEEDNLRPVLVQVSVEDKKTGTPLEGAKLNLKAKDGSGISGEGKTNIEGVYTFKVKPDSTGKYTLSATMEGYKKQSIQVEIPAAESSSQSVPEQISLSKLASDKTSENKKDASDKEQVQPEQTKAKVRESEQEPEKEKETKEASEEVDVSVKTEELRNIYFDSDKAAIKPKYHERLDGIVNKFQNNSEIKLKIIGHTDNIDTKAYNKKLSLKRARSVKAYLVEHGISEDRLITEGKGENDPIASNDDEEAGRELNRRVEFKVIK